MAVKELSEILRKLGDASPTFYLKVHVIHGSRTMKLHGWHTPGEPWHVLEYDEMIEFTDREMVEAQGDAQVDMARRPIKQPGFDYHWEMVSHGRGKTSEKLMRAAHADAVERRKQQQRFEELEIVHELEMEYGD